MQMFRTLEYDTAAKVGRGVQVLLISPTGKHGHIARHLAGMGGRVDVEHRFYDALSHLINDPRAAQILVVDCDPYGGFDTGLRGFAILSGHAVHLPVILISAACAEQTFPQVRHAPIRLRAPVSAVALRVAFDAAFQGRRMIGAL